jgi:uronate dehydrogenase
MTGRVLVTGAAGAVGTTVSRGLAERYQLRAVDLRAPEPPYPGEVIIGDCADPATALRAVEGVGAVVHLAGIATEASLPEILHSHVSTTAALLDAMVLHGVPLMVFASSNHAVGMTPAGGRLGVDARPRPDTFYGVGKVAAEALLSLYADRYGVSSVAVRIGSFEPAPTTRRHLATWLSPADCVRMVEACLTAQFDGHRVIYGISANRDGWWDLGPGRELGYDPQDDASVHEHDIPSRPEDESDAARVGGLFATGEYDRRPFAQDD